jgi:Phage terminase-like protein, large subunit
VDFAREVLEVEPLPWQRWLLIHALELRPDGRFRFRTVLILVARQNGKTTIVEVKNLWKMFVLQVALVIGTAQNLDISEESWDKAVEIVESVPELAAEIKHVDKTNGKKALKLTHGSRWKIAAASRKGGRGLSGDDVNLDELREHLDWLAWGAVTKTTMARPNAQVYAFSNAGDDRSVVLNDLQAKGRAAAKNPAGADPTLGHFEWSAPDDVRCTCVRPEGELHRPDCRLWDRRAWAQANPSLGYTVTEEAIATALGTDPEPIFRTEVLCQRVESLVPEWQVIGQAAWTDAHDPASQLEGRPAIGVYVPPDRSYAAIGLAGARSDGGRHIEVAGDGQTLDYRPGTGWVVARLQELERHKPSVVVIDDKALAEEAEKAGLVVHRANVGDMVTGCGLLYDGVCGPDVAARDVHHIGQKDLTDAVAGAVKRDVGGSWAWARRDLAVDVTTLAAVSLALFGHSTPRVHRADRRPAAAFVATVPRRAHARPADKSGDDVTLQRLREQLERDLAGR